MKYIFGLVLLLLVCNYTMSQQKNVMSRLEVYTIASGKRTIVYEEDAHFEAPNWSLDNTYYIINQNGLLHKISVDGKSKTTIDTDFAKQCNNDHGISPDGQTLAISNNDVIEGKNSETSRIYTVSIRGGTPKLITPLLPSYWHGWSPDGSQIAFTCRISSLCSAMSSAGVAALPASEESHIQPLS